MSLWGGADLFGPSCTEGWKYLAQACDRWEWLAPIFGDELEYRASLVAYYTALNIHELASIIASGQQNVLEASLSSMPSFHFTVPPPFLPDDYNITRHAINLLHNQEGLTKLWTCLNVTCEQMENSWEDWIRVSAVWLRNVYKFSVDTRIYHENLSKVLQP